jgi:hypothetical protein
LFYLAQQSNIQNKKELRMDNPMSASEMGSKKLEEVHEGMPVYDQQQHKIGEVETVYLGSVSEQASEMGEGPQTTGGSASPLGRDDVEGFPPIDRNENVVSFAFGGGTHLNDFDENDPVRNRMIREGFIRIDMSGIFAGDRYALPEMVSSVSAEGVYLNISGDELINPREDYS